MMANIIIARLGMLKMRARTRAGGLVEESWLIWGIHSLFPWLLLLMVGRWSRIFIMAKGCLKVNCLRVRLMAAKFCTKLSVKATALFLQSKGLQKDR